MRRLILLLAILSLALAACGGAAAAPSGVVSLQSDQPDSSRTPEPSVDPEEAMLAFSRCMREQGVDIPDPGAGGGPVRVGGDEGIDPEKFQAANEACREHLEGVIGEEGPQLTPEQRDALLAFGRCMREHGIDMPDPGEGGFVVPAGGDEEVPDLNDPTFRAAEEACRHLMADLVPEPEGAGPGAGPGLPAGGGDQ
jgi:hypothetical protein